MYEGNTCGKTEHGGSFILNPAARAWNMDSKIPHLMLIDYFTGLTDMHPTDIWKSEDGTEPTQDCAVNNMGDDSSQPGARMGLAAKEAVPGYDRIEETLGSKEEDAAPEQPAHQRGSRKILPNQVSVNKREYDPI